MIGGTISVPANGLRAELAAFGDANRPESWKQQSLLRAVIPVVFTADAPGEGGRSRVHVGHATLVLSRRQGLDIKWGKTSA